MSEAPRPEELFAGVADDYVRHRPPYPAELLGAIGERFALKAGVRVLDLGCGPGVLSLSFAETGAEVVGVDPSPDMLAAARAASGERENLRFVLDTAEKAPLTGRFRLAVLGRSFHWFDRERVLKRLDALIERESAVVVFKEDREGAWRPLVRELQQRWLPDGPRAHRRHAERLGGGDHESVLSASTFALLEELRFDVARA